MFINQQDVKIIAYSEIQVRIFTSLRHSPSRSVYVDSLVLDIYTGNQCIIGVQKIQVCKLTSPGY